MLLESLMDSCFSIKSFLSLSVVKLSKDLRSSGEGLNGGSIGFKHKGTDYKDNFSLGAFKIGGWGEGKLIGKLFPIQNMRYARSSSYFSDHANVFSRRGVQISGLKFVTYSTSQYESYGNL